MSLIVELRPYVATEKRAVGGGVVEREVHFPQCYVMVNGKQVGLYCGKKNEDGTYQHGRFLSFTEYQPPDVQQMLAEEVEKIIGGPVGNFASVPKPQHAKKAKDGTL
jgi:hypothetical protein